MPSLIEPTLVRERSTTVGTGAYGLLGAATGYYTFASQLAEGDWCYAVVRMPGNTNIEIGRYTLTSGALVRTEILKSTNADAAVSWPEGTKDIVASRPGLSLLDAAGLAEWLALFWVAGIPYVWSTNTANSDPTSGKLKINHGTPASATALYISETDAEGQAMAAVLAAWDDGTSTVRGRLRIENPVTGAFLEMEITGTLTDNGGWDTFVIQNCTGTVHADATAVRLFFTPKGDKGDTGATGATGPTGPAGSGDVVGPASATDNAIARFDLTTGKLIQDTAGVTLSDAGLLDIADSLSGGGVRVRPGNSGAVALVSGRVVVGAASQISFSSGGAGGSFDAGFRRVAADVVGMIGNTTTTAQTFQVYRTMSSSYTNYERAALNGGAGYFELAAETAGTGTDDIDLRLTPAGAGLVMFGAHSGIAAETVTGFITIKDAGGTTRKLAVVS